MNSTYVFIILALLSMTIACHSDDAVHNDEWYLYGQPITVSEVLTVSEAIERIDQVTDSPVLVEGTVTQVCQTRGCWMVVKDDHNSIRVRFADYGFFVPWESAGKIARIQGTIKVETVSEDVARHWAEKAQPADVSPDEIHGDQHVAMMTATGVSILGGTPISPDQRAVIDGETDPHDPHE